MKSIITFGVALLAMTANAASSGFSELDSTFTGNENGTSVQAKFSNEDAVLNPSAYISSGYSKSVEEISADNNQVVEAKQDVKAPLYFETSVSQIKQDAKIVDAKTAEYAPLDFRYINKAQLKLSIPAALPKL